MTVIGNSVGGWIAAEMAIHASSRISSAVLVDAGGLEVDDHPAADFFSLTPDQVTEMAYYRPHHQRPGSATVIAPGIAGGQRGDIVRRRSRVGIRERVMIGPMPVLCLMAIAACPALMCGA